VFTVSFFSVPLFGVCATGNVNQTTELEFKEFEPERNVFEDFDAE
jgi:hypothetical protein